MIVLDASAAVDLLLAQRDSDEIALLVAAHEVHTIDLAYVEVTGVLRRWELKEDLSAARAQQVLDDLFDLPMEVHMAADFVRHTWPLRASVTTFDALYLLLAQALDAPLLTTDRRLGRVATQWCSVIDLALH